MFFDKQDVDYINGNKVVSLSTLIERISNTIEDKIAYEPDYHDHLVVRIEDAEELMIGLYNIVRQIK